MVHHFQPVSGLKQLGRVETGLGHDDCVKTSQASTAGSSMLSGNLCQSSVSNLESVIVFMNVYASLVSHLMAGSSTAAASAAALLLLPASRS